jgi:hypothetical protein
MYDPSTLGKGQFHSGIGLASDVGLSGNLQGWTG